MAFKKATKVHLQKFKIKGGKIYYYRVGSICGTSDIFNYKRKEFLELSSKYPKEVCKNCVKKYKEIFKK